ncbi:hypothetical protein ACWAT4_37130 [Bradyrhizobium manausense]
MNKLAHRAADDLNGAQPVADVGKRSDGCEHSANCAKEKSSLTQDNQAEEIGDGRDAAHGRLFKKRKSG